MTTLSRRILSSAMLAGAALVLSACGSTDEADAGLEGDAIAAIAAPDGQEWNEIVNVSDEGGYVLGNPEAPLKLIEYASHTCSHCAEFAKNGAEELKAKYVSSGVVSLELRNLIRDPIDLSIATLVRCGQKENMIPLADQAWASLDQIFANVNANSAAYEAAGALPTDQRFIAIAQAAGLIDFFAARGLSSDQARTCLADGANIEALAQRSQDQQQELGVTGTPTFFLNGQKLEVNQWAALEPILQRAGAR